MAHREAEEYELGPQPTEAQRRPAAADPLSVPDSGVRLAEIKEAVLDDSELRTLFADIATYGKVLEVTMKSTPRSRSDPVRRLPELYLKLIERRVYGAQVRYEFESATWLDTLITTPAGCRLVRVRLPD